MTIPPKLSVIIPCFNHGEFLLEAVSSVTSMNRDDVELIVVDDGSTDERTRKEMDSLVPQGIHVIRQQNKGLPAARNAGIRASQAEYIFPLDADDRALPSFVERAIRIFEASPKVGVIYGDVQFIGTRTERWAAGPFEPLRLLQSNYIASSAVFRRTVWEQNGGYDERMRQGFEDWEFWISAYEHGWQFAYIPEPLFEYRQHGPSMLTEALKVKDQVAQYVAAKHGALYGREWRLLAFEHDSGKATFRNLRRIVKTRIQQKLHLNGYNAR